MNHYDSTQPSPRDLVGYGRDVPHAQWPGGARIAVQAQRAKLRLVVETAQEVWGNPRAR